ncbi:outer membrane protein [Bradyrhizobium japonicum]|uniref:outer membrane protein n=1 Tax=Bradyrhizobium japonicum TaxID=375 RepID=UPI0002E1E68E|nr:hypothetical protein [Bradyrhizobium japonicum]
MHEPSFTDYGFEITAVPQNPSRCGGATFGGGFERFLTDGISARAEYRVTHLGARDDLASDFMTSLSAGGMVHTLRGVLAYHLPTP